MNHIEIIAQIPGTPAPKILSPEDTDRVFIALAFLADPPYPPISLRVNGFERTYNLAAPADRALLTMVTSTIITDPMTKVSGEDAALYETMLLLRACVLSATDAYKVQRGQLLDETDAVRAELSMRRETLDPYYQAIRGEAFSLVKQLLCAPDTDALQIADSLRSRMRTLRAIDRATDPHRKALHRYKADRAAIAELLTRKNSSEYIH